MLELEDERGGVTGSLPLSVAPLSKSFSAFHNQTGDQAWRVKVASVQGRFTFLRL